MAVNRLGTGAVNTFDTSTAPPATPDITILFVASSVPTSAADQIIIDYLNQGLVGVTVIADENLVSNSADGFDLVYISSSADAATLGTTANSFSVPIINANPNTFSNMNMGVGATTNANTLLFEEHPVIEANPAETVTITLEDLSTGTPNANAHIVARYPDNSPAIFIYEQDAPLINLTPAPARRIGYYLNEAGAQAWTVESQSILETIVEFALEPRIPASASVDVSMPNVTINATGSVSIPAVTADGNYTLPTLALSGTASATLESATIEGNYTLPSLAASGSASATLPQPTGITAYEIPVIAIQGAGSASQTGSVVNGSYTLLSLEISASGNATLPNPVASGEYTIPNLDVQMSATILGLEIVVDPKTNIDQHYQSNKILYQ